MRTAVLPQVPKMLPILPENPSLKAPCGENNRLYMLSDVQEGGRKRENLISQRIKSLLLTAVFFFCSDRFRLIKTGNGRYS
ncbi:hypothetical protein ES705_48633 [subsurface metagenome]